MTWYEQKKELYFSCCAPAALFRSVVKSEVVPSSDICRQLPPILAARPLTAFDSLMGFHRISSLCVSFYLSYIFPSAANIIRKFGGW